MATSNESRDPPMAEPGKRQAGADRPTTSTTPASDSAKPASTAGAARPGWDDDEEPWRHAPVAPRDEGPLKSLGRSVSETVTGPLDDKKKPKA